LEQSISKLDIAALLLLTFLYALGYFISYDFSGMNTAFPPILLIFISFSKYNRIVHQMDQTLHTVFANQGNRDVF
jgi:hypothetical protein